MRATPSGEIFLLIRQNCAVLESSVGPARNSVTCAARCCIITEIDSALKKVFPTFRFSQESCSKYRKWTEGLVQGMEKPQ